MKLVSLGELGDFKNGVNFKSERMGRGVPLINVKDITTSHRIDPSALDLVDVQANEDLIASTDDIFFVRSSVKLDGIALVGKITSNGPQAIHCGFVIRFRPTSPRVSSDYLVYLLLSPEYRQRLIGLSGGAAIVNISQTNLKSLPVPLPPLGVQRKIADILTAYDDLMENNRRRMALLEESARLLYREWFVSLRFPGHEHIRTVDSVPEGWEKKKIQDVCVTVGGGTPSTKNSAYWDGGEITWVVPTDITRNNSLVLLDSEKKITDMGLRESSAKMLPPETILMTSRASVGFFGLIDKEVCTNQGFISVIPNEDYHRMYLLFNLMSRRDEILNHAGGATYKEISKGTFRNFEILIPTHTLLKHFQDFAYGAVRQVRLLKKQNQRLQQARDLLLSHLMSGQLTA